MDPAEALSLFCSLLDRTPSSQHPQYQQSVIPPNTAQAMSASSTPSRQGSPPPKHNPHHNSTKPARPVLKLPIPPNPFLPHYLPSSADDLSVLVSDALGGNMTPKRQTDAFRFVTLPANPVAPPPTPVAWDVMGTPSEKGEGLSPTEWLSRFDRSRSGSRSSSGTPRMSGEMKRVSFKEEWQDDQGRIGSGRVSDEYRRGRTGLSEELKMTMMKRM